MNEANLKFEELDRIELRVGMRVEVRPRAAREGLDVHDERDAAGQRACRGRLAPQQTRVLAEFLERAQRAAQRKCERRLRGHRAHQRGHHSSRDAALHGAVQLRAAPTQRAMMST